MTYAVETELSSRVRQWEHRIRPILEEEVHLYCIMFGLFHELFVNLIGTTTAI